jgi:hypothetical protein
MRRTPALLALLAALLAPTAAPARPAPAIPPEFRGLWGPDACRGRDQDPQVRLTAHRVDYNTAGGEVLAVRRQGSHGLRITMRLIDEGMAEVTVVTFRLSADGRTLTNTTFRPWEAKTRCA